MLDESLGLESGPESAHPVVEALAGPNIGSWFLTRPVGLDLTGRH